MKIKYINQLNRFKTQITGDIAYHQHMKSSLQHIYGTQSLQDCLDIAHNEIDALDRLINQTEPLAAPHIYIQMFTRFKTQAHHNIKRHIHAGEPTALAENERVTCEYYLEHFNAMHPVHTIH